MSFSFIWKPFSIIMNNMTYTFYASILFFIAVNDDIMVVNFFSFFQNVNAQV